jgi:hypothetical protein
MNKKTDEKKPKIFGIKKNNEIFYIGKTIQYNDDGKMNKSYSSTYYLNDKIRSRIYRSNVEFVELIETEPCCWYDERNNQVHKHHEIGDKLVNADWMKEGRKSYWHGLKRDKHTLKRLSESKYKSIVEYDEKGNLKKIWKSTKEAAIVVLKDYRVVNGSGKSELYSILKYKNPEKRFKHNSYWFKYSELKKWFGQIPKKINIENMIQYYRNERKKYFYTEKHKKIHAKIHNVSI